MEHQQDQEHHQQQQQQQQVEWRRDKIQELMPLQNDTGTGSWKNCYQSR
jgi:hypothetical protein